MLAAVAALIPLAFDHGYYFTGDTAAGAYGQWYAIGTRILQGHWTDVLDPHVWQAGVLLADGAWGFFSPVQWAIGLASHVVTNALVLTAGLKVALVVWVASGTYLLARSFGVPAPWASLAGIAAPLSGWAMMLDLTSFVTGAIAWSFLPWAWAGLRAFVAGRAPVAAALVPAALLIGIVYTHATLMLVLVVVAVLIEVLLDRRGSLLRIAVSGASIALMVVIVHLPALLVYPSTGRVHGIGNDGTLAADWTSLMQSATVVARSAMVVPGGGIAPRPYTYLAWFLPLAVFISWRRLRPLLRSRASLLIVTGGLLLFVQAPSQIGPLRFPGRLLPYLAVAVVVLVVLGLGRARIARPSRGRAAAAAALIVAGTWTSLVTDIASASAILAGAVLSTGVLVATVVVLDRRTRLRARVAVVGAGIATVLLLLPVHAEYRNPGGIDYGLATHVASYTAMLPGARGDVFVVGDELDGKGPGMARQAALGNAWYIATRPVQNAYTTLTYPSYGQLLCMQQKGTTCPAAFTTLFERDAATGRRWVDLFGISTIELIKPSFRDGSWRTVPPGWHVLRDSTLTRLLERNRVVPGAGHVVWSGSGTAVTPLTESDTAVRFRIDRVGSDARVVLSRLAWPGYTAQGASVGARTDGMLLTVDLPKRGAGTIVTVRYAAPGAPVILAAAVLLALVLLAWAARSVVLRRRRPAPGRPPVLVAVPLLGTMEP